MLPVVVVVDRVVMKKYRGTGSLVGLLLPWPVVLLGNAFIVSIKNNFQTACPKQVESTLERHVTHTKINFQSCNKIVRF